MYACVYAYACMHVCMFERMHVCMHTCIHAGPKAREKAAVRTRRALPPAGIHPRTRRRSVSPLDQHEGNGVQEWTPADAADLYHRPRIVAELGHREYHTKPSVDDPEVEIAVPET